MKFKETGKWECCRLNVLASQIIRAAHQTTSRAKTPGTYHYKRQALRSPSSTLLAMKNPPKIEIPNKKTSHSQIEI
jgi:hypothetical protein